MGVRAHSLGYRPDKGRRAHTVCTAVLCAHTIPGLLIAKWWCAHTLPHRWTTMTGLGAKLPFKECWHNWDLNQVPVWKKCAASPTKLMMSHMQLPNHTDLYCTVLYCTVLYCTVLYCTVLYCTVLYCTLYCVRMGNRGVPLANPIHFLFYTKCAMSYGRPVDW